MRLSFCCLFCLIIPAEASFLHFLVMDKKAFISFTQSSSGWWSYESKGKVAFITLNRKGEETRNEVFSLSCKNLYENVQRTVEAFSASSSSDFRNIKTNELTASLKKIPCYFAAKAVADMLGVLYKSSQNISRQSPPFSLNQESVFFYIQNSLASWNFPKFIVDEVLKCFDDSIKDGWVTFASSPEPNKFLLDKEIEAPLGPAYNAAYHKIFMHIDERDSLTLPKLLHEIGHLIDAILAKQKMKEEGYPISEVLELEAAHKPLNPEQKGIYNLFCGKYMHNEKYSLLLELCYVLKNKNIWAQYVLEPAIFDRAAFFLAYSFVECILEQPERFKKFRNDCEDEEYLDYLIKNIFLKEKNSSSVEWILSGLKKLTKSAQEYFFEAIKAAFCEVLRGTWTEGFGSKYIEGFTATISALQKFPNQRPYELLNVVSEKYNLSKNESEKLVEYFLESVTKTLEPSYVLDGKVFS